MKAALGYYTKTASVIRQILDDSNDSKPERRFHYSYRIKPIDVQNRICDGVLLSHIHDDYIQLCRSFSYTTVRTCNAILCDRLQSFYEKLAAIFDVENAWFWKQTWSIHSSLHHTSLFVVCYAKHIRGVVKKFVSFNRRRLGTRLRPTLRLYIILLIKNALWLDTLHALYNKIIDVEWRHPKTAFFSSLQPMSG